MRDNGRELKFAENQLTKHLCNGIKVIEENGMLKTNAGRVTMADKTLCNSDLSGARENVKDLQVVGDGDMFKLLCKASSEAEGWMKSTKAMEISGVGCIVQVTTQQGDNPAEAAVFVPDVKIADDRAHPGGRRLVKNKH